MIFAADFWDLVIIASWLWNLNLCNKCLWQNFWDRNFCNFCSYISVAVIQESYKITEIWSYTVSTGVAQFIQHPIEPEVSFMVQRRHTYAHSSLICFRSMHAPPHNLTYTHWHILLRSEPRQGMQSRPHSFQLSYLTYLIQLRTQLPHVSSHCVLCYCLLYGWSHIYNQTTFSSFIFGWEEHPNIKEKAVWIRETQCETIVQ